MVKLINSLFFIVLLLFPAMEVFADQKARPKMSEVMPEKYLNPEAPASIPANINNPYTIRKLSDGTRTEYHPEFSPDGKKIVYITKTDVREKIRQGEFWHKSPFYLNLWIMDGDGQNRKQLTSGEFYDIAPRFTPAGDKIYFVSTRRGGNWDIWSMDIDGSNPTRVTGEVDRDHYPNPAADDKVVFISYKGAHGSVWMMDMDGENQRRVTTGGFGDDFPLMSPDGREIVFKSTRQGNGDIWTIDKEGRNYKRLTYEDYPEFYPAWSPDGSMISYITNKGGIFDVWVMDKDGNHKKKLTQYLSKGDWGAKFNYDDLVETGYYHVSWHPDGRKMALTTWEPGQKGSFISILEFEKNIVEIANELPTKEDPVAKYTLIGEKELTRGNWEDITPSFHPDGKSIIFASNRTGNWDIWSIEVKSEEVAQLTKNSAAELAPVFSPDGRKIAYLSETSNSKYDLWMMESNGIRAKRVTTDISISSYPAWGPDSQEIAFVSTGADGPEVWLHNLDAGTRKRVGVIWDLEKSGPLGDPFAKKKKMKLTVADREKLIKLFPKSKGKMGNLSPFTKGEDILISYPLKDFLYRVDFDATGTWLAFESNRSGNIGIWKMKKDGTGMTRITKGDGPHLNPVFSPDGRKVAYTREKLSPNSFNQPNYNIWIADLETGEETMVNGEEQYDWNPAWSPDGKKMAYVTNRSGDFKHFSLWMLYLK